jgi:hypothetical protein
MQPLFQNHSHKAVYLPTEAELPQAIQALNLRFPAPVLVLVGGAAGVEGDDRPNIEGAVREIAKAVEAAGAIVLDGGTQSGVMACIGQARSQGNYKFPLVGVAVENLVTWPGRHEAEGLFDKPHKHWPLESNHSHFILVPGNKWGDESPWIAKAASWISTGRPSVTVLINGGSIARKDIANSVIAGREVVILRGSGRFADELAEIFEKPAEAEGVRRQESIQDGAFTIFDMSASLNGLEALICQKLQIS